MPFSVLTLTKIRPSRIYMVGQMKLPTSPFNGADWSMKEAAPQRNWEQEAESRITRSDVVVVLVGPNTYKAPGVLKEVEITRRVGKPIVQIIGYKDSKPDSRAERRATVEMDLAKHDIGPGRVVNLVFLAAGAAMARQPARPCRPIVQIRPIIIHLEGADAPKGNLSAIPDA